MFDTLRKEWHQFHKAHPGHRFAERHERHSCAGSGWRQRILLVIGVFLIVFGLATLFIPPIPGITLVVVGALMCAQASAWAAQMCDKCEMWIRKGWRRLRGK